MVSLEVAVRDHRRGVDVRLAVPSGQTLALVGPNGAGKSTVLGTVAGLLRPDGARVRVAETTLADEHVFVAPHRRNVSLLAQDALLFPHLTVAQNVAFGPRSRGVRDHDAVARRWLDDLGLGALADRRPAQLSGGQAQRVAVARALAIAPDVVLLDEPLAALDAAAVPEVRRLLRRVLADRTTLLVTHDPLDALVLAERTVVLEDGRIADDGPTREVLAHPRSAFAAAWSGVNLVEGVMVAAGRLRDAAGREFTGLSATDLPLGSTAQATFAPQAVGVFRHRPEGSPRTVLRATVRLIEPRGASCRIEADGILADVTAASVAELDLELGVTVWLALKATEVRLYAA